MAATTRFKGERVLTLVLALFPAVWLWLDDVSAWFNYLMPTEPCVIPYLDSIGMAEESEPYVYVAFALVLMCLSLAYVGLVITRWHGRNGGRDDTVLQDGAART